MTSKDDDVDSLVDDIRDYWDPWSREPERLAEFLVEKGWRKLNAPTDSERRAAARIRVISDKKRGVITPDWITRLAEES